MIIADGIHELTRAQYDEVDRVNFSTVKWFAKSPAHYRHFVDSQAALRNALKFGTLDDDDTEARLRGRVVSMAVFEPWVFDACAIWTGGRRYGRSWTTFQLEHATAPEIITEGLRDDARKISRAVRNSGQAMKYLHKARCEVTIAWTHRVAPIAALPGWEIECKCRLDALTDVAILDLKNSRKGDLEGFGRECGTYHAHVQAAMYRDAVLAVTGKRLPYKLIAVEPEPPFVVQVYNVTEQQLTVGQQTYRDWLGHLNHCRTTRTWGGYADSELDLQLPRWIMPYEEDAEN